MENIIYNMMKNFHVLKALHCHNITLSIKRKVCIIAMKISQPVVKIQ